MADFFSPGSRINEAKRKPRGTHHHIIAQVLWSLAHLHSLHLLEYSYACFLYNVHIQLYLVGWIWKSISTPLFHKQKEPGGLSRRYPTCNTKNRDIYWRRYKIQETLYTGQWHLSPLQSRHLGTSHSSPNHHQMPRHIFLNLIDNLKSRPCQRWFEFWEKLKLQGTKSGM